MTRLVGNGCGRGLTAAGVVTALAVVLIAAPTNGSDAAVPRRGAGARCEAPHLVGLTVASARRLVAHASCELVLTGARVRQPTVQTVERQSRRGARTVVLAINPFCAVSAAPGPGIREPRKTRGRSGLVSGLYVEGGPVRLFSVRACREPRELSSPGEISITPNASPRPIATQTLAAGQLARINLPPGRYRITGRLAVGTGTPEVTRVVTIPPHTTVREDVIVGVP